MTCVSQDRDLSASSSSVLELTARLKKFQQLNSELCSVDEKVKENSTESSMEIAELKRDVEYFKRNFVCCVVLFTDSVIKNYY